MTDPRLTSRRWKATVRAVLQRDGHVCAWCGDRATTADHVIARKVGGSDAMSNLVAACLPCNSSRGARPGPPPRLARRPRVAFSGPGAATAARVAISLPRPPAGVTSRFKINYS